MEVVITKKATLDELLYFFLFSLGARNAIPRYRFFSIFTKSIKKIKSILSSLSLS